MTEEGDISVNRKEIITKVKRALVDAGSTFRCDQKQVYRDAIEKEQVPAAKWVLESILDNAEVAEKNLGPLCDDTGIPHLILEIGTNRTINGELLEAINCGISAGLDELPGRPMAVLGDDMQRLDQSQGLDSKGSALVPAPLIIKPIKEDVIRLHILMLGGGPAIRAKTYRVFHKRNSKVVADSIIDWAIQDIGNLGCTPSTLAVGVGRSHFEASSMMIQAMAYGQFDKQSEMEKYITQQVNKSDVGPLGLHGNCTALATFMRVGPQRASGIRVVCLRPCCCFEPRRATVEL